jgi:hypothetical protein
MSFDINEAVFDKQGTYLEEKAVRYEEGLMDQFAASSEGQAIKEKGTGLGWGDDPCSHRCQMMVCTHHSRRRRRSLAS